MRVSGRRACARLAPILLLASLAWASGVAAQSKSVSLPVEGLRPADVVARLAHKALAAPGQPNAWKDLASALPEMALGDNADLETTFAAARVADSLAAPTAATAATATETAASPSGSTGLRATGSSLVVQARRALAVLAAAPLRVRWIFGLLALALGGIVVWMVRSGSRRHTATPAPAGGRLWTARALAAGGTDVREIAQRTGMAQEAVDLALRMAGGASKQAPRRRRGADAPSPSGTATRRRRVRMGRPASDAEARRLGHELVRGVRDLRDGRLTYGTGARR